MKKLVLAFLILALALLCWSPWMDDSIEKVTENSEVQAELEELTSQYSYDPETGEGCDGLSSDWMPFGRKVEYCDHASWYLTFWGQTF